MKDVTAPGVKMSRCYSSCSGAAKFWCCWTCTLLGSTGTSRVDVFLSLVILLQLMPVFGVKWSCRKSFLEVEADTKGISWQYSPCNVCAGLWVRHPTARNKDQGLESGQQQHWRQTARLARLPSCLPAQELDGVVGIVRSFRPTHLGMANRREVDDRQQVPRKQD